MSNSYRLAAYFAILELKRKYRRTILGTFWQTAAFGFFILLMGIVWSKVWNANIAEFLPYLSSGIITWTFISSSMNDSCLSITAGEGYIKNYQIEPLVFPLTAVIRNFLNLLHNLVIYIVILVYFQRGIDYDALVAFFIGLCILMPSTYFTCAVISYVVVRFRDVQQLIALFTQVALFVTPIFFETKNVGGGASKWYFDYNLLYQFAKLIREPLLNRLPDYWTYFFTILYLIFSYIIYKIILKKYTHRIVYWI